jgi:hypothetical protein
LEQMEKRMSRLEDKVYIIEKTDEYTEGNEKV